MKLPACETVAILAFMVVTTSVGAGADECVRRDYGHGSFVCVCNSTYCDRAPSVGHLAAGDATIITSTKNGARFQSAFLNFSESSNSLLGQEIVVDSSITFQSILGFGGAFTDAAGINLAKLGVVTQERLLKAYFSEEGIEYGIGRVPIGGTDFSTHTYSYDDWPADVSLSNFSLTEEDLVYKIPYIDWARSFSSKPIRLFASPWTAPAWMKTNNQFYGLGRLKQEYFQVWAEYFVRFFQEYEKHNMTFWGVTAQNEPLDGEIPDFAFNCMGWTPESQADFVGLNLGPTMQAKGFGHVKIMIMDDQRMLLPKWPVKVMANPEASKYVSGIAVHWYEDFLASPSVLTKTHELLPELFILATEACEGYQPLYPAVVLGAWERLESYAHDILQDLNNWVSGWVDWNLVLDEHGGPNWADNFVDSPIIANATANEFYKQPMYYAMGHVSKYIPEGSRRIGLQMHSQSAVEATAFLRPDAMITVVILNRSDQEKTIIIKDANRGAVEFQCPARSLQTLVYG